MRGFDGSVSVRNCMETHAWREVSLYLYTSFSTFQLDCDAALQLFIETLLHNTNASQGQGDMSTQSAKQQHPKLLAKALEMVPLLTSTKDLVISLSGILHKVDEWGTECIGSLQTSLLPLVNLGT